MKLIIFGALCLRIWQAGALSSGYEDGYLSSDHLPTLSSLYEGKSEEDYGEQSGSEFVSKSIGSYPREEQETQYIGVLVDTAPVKEKALAQARIQSSDLEPFYSAPPPTYADYPPIREPPIPMPTMPFYPAPPPTLADYPPIREPPIPMPTMPFYPAPPPTLADYPPIREPPIPMPTWMPSGPLGANPGSDVFKLVAYLTQDGVITKGRLISIQDRPTGESFYRPGARTQRPYPPQIPYYPQRLVYPPPPRPPSQRPSHSGIVLTPHIPDSLDLWRYPLSPPQPPQSSFYSQIKFSPPSPLLSSYYGDPYED